MSVSYEVILAPILTLFVVQSIKLATDGIKGNFNLKNVLSVYGGMPSSHTAVVTSLTAMVGYTQGFECACFAISVIFSLVVIADAIMLRKYIDQNSRAVKMLVEKVPAEERDKFPKVVVNLRHTLPQVLVGALIGFAIATLIQFLYQ